MGIMRQSTRRFSFGACVAAFCWLPAVLPADDSSPPVAIHLTDWKIKLLQQVILASDRPGILKFVEPKEGDSVRAKQRVAGLQDDLVQAELAAAEHKATNDIEVRAGEKARDLAVTEYDQARRANADVKNTVPLIELHKLKLAAEKSLLEIELAKHELIFSRLQRDLKRTELETFAIIAPFSGVVTKVFKQRGEAVRQGDPILELTNTDHVRVEGWLDLEHTWKVAVGNRVLVRLSVPEASLPIEETVHEGRVTFVDVTVQPVTRQTRIFAEVANLDNILRAGLNADMAIQLNTGTESTFSPEGDTQPRATLKVPLETPTKTKPDNSRKSK
jgi:membrane fusion protein (multidrug efflux system)